MPINKEDIINAYAFTISTESLGPIRVWRIPVEKVFLEVIKRFRGISEVPANEFVRTLIPLAATHLNPENERQKGDPVTADEAGKLTDEELEQISLEVIKHHTYLFEDHENPMFEKGEDKQGRVLVGVSPGKLEIPKKPGESDCQYLRRLINDFSERKDRAAQKSISKTLSRLDEENARIGRSITDSIDSIRMQSLQDPMKEMHSSFLIPPDPQYTTNERLNEALDILEDQREIYDATAKSIERLTELALTWEKSAKENSEQSSLQVRTSNNFAKWALIVAVVSLIVSVIGIIVSVIIAH